MSLLLSLANNKFFVGTAILIVNMGSRYVISDAIAVHEKLLQHKLVKQIVIFSIVFVATRDIMTSIMLTFAFNVVSSLLNSKSKYNFLWKYMK